MLFFMDAVFEHIFKGYISETDFLTLHNTDYHLILWGICRKFHTRGKKIKRHLDATLTRLDNHPMFFFFEIGALEPEM